MSSELLTQVFSIVGPALLAFAAGHFHVLLSPTKPTTPVAPPPAVPATPPDKQPVPNVAPVSPDILPIGQGGLIQILSLFLAAINTHPAATPDQKAAAANAVIDASKPLLVAVPK